MDPTFISDEPGKSPMGMDLVPVYEDDTQSSTNTISIDPVVIQNMGVRIDHVTKRNIIRNIRTVGKVQLADDRSYSINLKYSGWIEKIYADEIGQKLKKGDPLFQIYSPELISAQEEYLNAVKTYGQDSDFARSSARRLQLWSIPSSHLQKLIAEDNAQKNPEIYTPLSGYVLHKTIQQGSFVQAGKDLYHLGNLDEIWIIADLYEFDIPFLKLGNEVEIELTNLPGQKLSGKIDYIYPTLKAKTRTQQIRIELKNDDHKLKPGMFATLNIQSEIFENVLAIPSEAIIHSGSREIVFLSLGNGNYQAQEITSGVIDDIDGYTQVISGLQENEVVVVSGQFLLDSESQLREAVQKLVNAKLEETANFSETEDEHSHDTYFTCPMHPAIVQDESGDCPICGMDLVEKK
jgi:membrane fusion protein, copper/silver efflux system